MVEDLDGAGVADGEAVADRGAAALARAVMDAAPDAIVVLDEGGSIREFNPAAERAFGHRRGTVLGRPFAEVAVAPRLRSILAADLTRQLATGRSRLVGRRIEVEGLRADGSTFPAELALTEARAGPERLLVAHVRDIGERRAMERALRESEARFHAAADSLADGLAIFDPADRLAYHNARFAAHLMPGVRAALAPGKRLADMVREGMAGAPVYHEDMGPDFLARRLALRELPESDHEQHLADGRWLRVRETRMPDGGRVMLMSDITARRDERRELNEQRRKLEAVLANIADGVSIVDATGRVVLVNDGFLRLYGFPAELGRPGTPLASFVEHRLAAGRRLPGEPADIDTDVLVRRRVAEVLSQGPLTFEEETPDGRTVLVRRERLPDGLLVSTYADITDRKLAEQRLRLMAAVVEQVGNSVEIAEGDELRLAYVNPAFTRLTGYTAEEALGRTPGSFLRSGHHDTAFFAGMEADRRAGRPWHGRLVSRHKDGHVIVQHASVYPLRAADGRITHSFAVKRDIGERERAEAALRESEARLAGFMEHAPVGMYLKDLDGRYVMLNAEMEKVLGRPVAAMLGKDPTEVFGPEEVGMIRASDCEVVRTGLPTRREEHLPDLDAWSLVIRFPVKNDLGAITHVGGFDLDIAAQRRALAELEASEQRFRAIIEDQTDLICRHGPDFLLTFSNLAHAQIFGRKPEELLGQHMLEDAGIPEPARSTLRAELAALTPEDPVVRGENEKVFWDGEVRWYEWLNRALFDADGRLTGYQSVGRDTTERRRAEAEIARQRDALHQQEKLSALGSLLAGVAHELNNPLAVVVGRALMLEEDVRDPAVTASVAKLRAAAERCARIVKTFLAMARQRPSERRPVSVNAVVEAALELLAYGLKSDGVEVVRELAPDLPSVSADEDQLHQVFLNLLVNAQQALREAPAPRRILVTTWGGHSGKVSVEVADTGPGVPPAIRTRIFDPFFTTKPEGLGTGLGLSVCHGIVTAHEGTVEAGERPGGGALFTVRLPAAGPVGESTATPPEPAASGAAARILVVDDEPEILAMVEEILRRDGHVTELAASGREALRSLNERACDLVISDLRMPDGDGRELHRALAVSRPDLARRMLFLTGDTLGVTPDELPGIDPGAMIEKPVEPAALRRAVRRRLESAGR